MIYNNPISYANDITPEMFAEAGRGEELRRAQGKLRRHPPHHAICTTRSAIATRFSPAWTTCCWKARSSGSTAGWRAAASLSREENQYFWELTRAGRWDEARAIYRWFTPLLHLDVSTKFVQYIKLVVQECGLGREWMRAPRLPLAGEERKRVLEVIHEGNRSRIAPSNLAGACSDAMSDPASSIPTPAASRRGWSSAAGRNSAAARWRSAARFSASEHDDFRRAVVNEPRGSDVLVGALLVEPTAPDCAAGVIFFNNVGCLAMCGHGTIGLVATLAHIGRIGPGEHRIETPVGVVTATLHEDGGFRWPTCRAGARRSGVTVEVPGHGTVTGDVAWGGNWFFLVEEPRAAA